MSIFGHTYCTNVFWYSFKSRRQHPNWYHFFLPPNTYLINHASPKTCWPKHPHLCFLQTPPHHHQLLQQQQHHQHLSLQWTKPSTNCNKIKFSQMIWPWWTLTSPSMPQYQTIPVPLCLSQSICSTQAQRSMRVSLATATPPPPLILCCLQLRTHLWPRSGPSLPLPRNSTETLRAAATTWERHRCHRNRNRQGRCSRLSISSLSLTGKRVSFSDFLI